jgi:CxxC-x17-CxxC domain-containing protein
MPDKVLTCRDCGSTFMFTAGEQEFFASRGLTNEPSRCPNCRAINKAQRNGVAGVSGPVGATATATFDRPRRELFPAVCSACGKETRVPFQPTGDRPVYCSDCFSTQRASQPPGRASGGFSRGGVTSGATGGGYGRGGDGGSFGFGGGSADRSESKHAGSGGRGEGRKNNFGKSNHRSKGNYDYDDDGDDSYERPRRRRVDW